MGVDKSRAMLISYSNQCGHQSI